MGGYSWYNDNNKVTIQAISSIDIYYKFCCPKVKQSTFDGASYGTSLPSVGRHTLSTIQLLVKLLYHFVQVKILESQL